MLPFHWGLLGLALFVAFTYGASINSAVNDDDVEEIDEMQRSKRSYKRGQTQSQYLNFGQPEIDGKAEAEATESGSRSTVSGTHGMGQAQSQFSSGDCSGCGVGSPVYEYSTGSPDPLTLGGNGIPYADGKPSSIIGLHGTSSSGDIGSDSSFPHGPVGQAGRPGAGRAFIPSAGISSGQSGQPGVSGGFSPANNVAGGPGAVSTFTPAIGGAGQLGRPAPHSSYIPGGIYAPGTSGTRQFGRPGSEGEYAPGNGYAPGTSGSGPIGRPGAASTYSPGSENASGVSGKGQISKPGTSSAFSPGTGYSPGSSDAGIYAPGIPGAGETGRPAASNSNAPGAGQTGRPGIGYTPGDSTTRQVGRPGTGSTYTPGSGYAPGASVMGQVGRPGTGGSYASGNGYVPSATAEGQVGRPGSGGIYAPGSGFAPSVENANHPGRFGSGDVYTPGGGYAPGTSSGAQIGRPEAGSGHFGAGQTGTYPMGQQGAPGMSFGYGPSGGSGTIRQQGATGPQTGVGFAPQVPTHGQQIPSFTPGASYSVPGGGKQQVSQYAPGGQKLPVYSLDGRRPVVVSGQPVQQLTTYGQPRQQIPGQQVSQPGSFYGPSSGFAPVTDQQISGYPQKSGYTPTNTGPTSGGTETLTGGPGAHYSVPGPQQILQQPGHGTHMRPGTGGMQQGVDSSGPQTGSDLQPIYHPQPGSGYGQPGSRTQIVESAGYPPDSSFSQPGAGVQQSHVPPSFDRPGSVVQQGGGAVFQPRFDKTSGDFMQPGVNKPGYDLPESVQEGAGLQPSGRQPGLGAVHPSAGIQPGTIYGPPVGSTQPGAAFGQTSSTAHQGEGQQSLFTHPSGSQSGSGFSQKGAGFQPSSGPFVPGSGRHGTALHQVPSGFQQVPGYATGYGQQGQPRTVESYPQETPYGGIQQSIQSGQQTGRNFGQYPGSGFSQPGSGHAPLPTAGVQHGAGIQPGSGTGYETNYAQAPRGQEGTGYGQIPGTPQYVHTGGDQTGDAVVRLPGSVVSQYGQGPQTIVQSGTTYIPGVSQTSGIQQSTGALGGQASGISEDAFSQAESSIGNGQAAASAQGKKNGGTAKTQVQGSYSSSGSFSASAMTSDNDRSASSQVTGGVEGAMSQSQGQGGTAQSQAQVQVNEKTGGTKASSQSGGIIHQSQSEVQANDKGGLADAQSSGPGQTSSQAQIGFRPGQDSEIVRSSGGGQASAQSGAHSGNSQSQIQGTSKYGVSYHGAAQSASGTKEQVATYREQNRDLFNTISQFGGNDAVTDRVDTVYTPALTSESDIPDLQLKASRTNKEATNFNKLDDDSILTDEEDEQEPYDEYEDEEDYYNENPIKMESKSTEKTKLETSPLYRAHTQKSPAQTQQVVVTDPSKKYNVVQNQNGRVQTHPARTTTENVPNGFRGTVNVEKKFHTKSLEPHKNENKLNITANEKSGNKPLTPDSFVTVTKSITGSMDNSKNPPKDNKNFQSTYYTKSSTCGYFTFSCNIVYGANGRSKICRPKAPTNGKC